MSASISTASCSSPKELTQAVPTQEAVLTLKAIVLNASPMHIINRINALSGVALVRNSSYNRPKPKKKKKLMNFHPTSNSLIMNKINLLTKLSPSSHLVTREEFFVFETFTADLGTTLSGSPNRELAFRLCQNH